MSYRLPMVTVANDRHEMQADLPDAAAEGVTVRELLAASQSGRNGLLPAPPDWTAG